MSEEYDDLSEERQEYFHDRAAELLSGLLWCQRTWEAWDVGNMTQEDFIAADEDELVVHDTAVRLYGLVQEGK